MIRCKHLPWLKYGMVGRRPANGNPNSAPPMTTTTFWKLDTDAHGPWVKFVIRHHQTIWTFDLHRSPSHLYGGAPRPSQRPVPYPRIFGSHRNCFIGFSFCRCAGSALCPVYVCPSFCRVFIAFRRHSNRAVAVFEKGLRAAAFWSEDAGTWVC